MKMGMNDRSVLFHGTSGQIEIHVRTPIARIGKQVRNGLDFYAYRRTENIKHRLHGLRRADASGTIGQDLPAALRLASFVLST